MCAMADFDCRGLVSIPDSLPRKNTFATLRLKAVKPPRSAQCHSAPLMGWVKCSSILCGENVAMATWVVEEGISRGKNSSAWTVCWMRSR
jgi:hypothetical protein